MIHPGIAAALALLVVHGATLSAHSLAEAFARCCAAGFRRASPRHGRSSRWFLGVGEQQPQAEPFFGKLIVLIDGGSFSTTADVAAHLRSWRRAVFVGEETAGTYEGNTSGLNALIVLPNSRLRFKVMMYGYWNAVEPQPGGRGVIPEHTAPVRVTDLLHGNDRPLGAALALLKSDPPS